MTPDNKSQQPNLSADKTQADDTTTATLSRKPTEQAQPIPLTLIVILVVVNAVLGLAPLKHGRAWENWLDVFYQWGVLFIFVPLGLTLLAIPLKIRDNSFQLKYVYYFGMFAAGLFTLQNLRHLH